MRRMFVALVVALVAAPVFVLADEPLDPRLVFRIDATPSGVTATITPPPVAEIPPQIELVATSAADVIVLDRDGAPMLRAGRSGAFGNERSRFLAGALDPTAPAPVASPQPNAPPVWRKLGAAAKVRWYERRAAASPSLRPKHPERASELAAFFIPVRVGSGQLSRIAGSIVWRPVLGAIVPSIVSVEPRVEGVTVQALPGPVPALQLRNDSPRTIEIIGRDGAPFARVGPDGVVANVNSPTFRDTKSLPPVAAGAKPDWKPQQREPVLVWLEKRAAFTDEPADAVLASRTRTVLLRWSVSGTLDGEPITIAGATSWVPRAAASPAADDAEPFPWLPAAAGGVAGVLGGAWLALRRARRGRDDAGEL